MTIPEDAELMMSLDDVRSFAVEILRAVGMPDEDSGVVAESMVWSASRGDPDHSLRRLEQIVRRARGGGLSVRVDWAPVRQKSGVTVLDAGHAWGVLAGGRGMGHAVDNAKRFGVGITTVRNCDNTGALGWYASLAVSARMIGVAVTNGAPLMPPPGGAPVKVIGNQAFGIGSPAGRHAPLILDTALSLTLHALREAAAKGITIDPGLVLDASGEPTVDPVAGLEGMLLPMGGHRGFGLAVMWEVLSGVLSGGSILDEIGEMADLDRPIGNSLFLMAIDPAAFVSYDVFVGRVDELIDRLHSSPTRSGVERVRVPGEASAHAVEAAMGAGVRVPAAHVSMLRLLADELGVSWPPS